MGSLASYLECRLPGGLTYSDAAQLCIRLYSTVDGVHDELLPLTKERLGDDFAQLARSGWITSNADAYASAYGTCFHQVTDRGHWIEVIASIFKIGFTIVDIERGEVIARMAGFGTTNGSLDPTTLEGERAVARQPVQALQSHSNIHPFAPVGAH